MIDYLLTFTDEAAAKAALSPLGFCTDEAWDQSRCLAVQIIVGQQPLVSVNVAVGGVAAQTDALPDYAPVYAQGFWVAISTPEPNDALYDVPGCMREADREKALAGEPYVLRERFTLAQLAAPWSITPQWCGVNYANDPAAQ